MRHLTTLEIVLKKCNICNYLRKKNNFITKIMFVCLLILFLMISLFKVQTRKLHLSVKRKKKNNKQQSIEYFEIYLLVHKLIALTFTLSKYTDKRLSWN